jgi:hypothetical protein
MNGSGHCNFAMVAGRRTRALVVAVSVFSAIDTAYAANLTGQASIIDGDTLEIHGTRIRLWGIDAPETHQFCRNEASEQYPCGQKAANDLDALIARRSSASRSIATDTSERWRSAPLPVSILRLAWRSTGHNIPMEHTRWRNRARSGPTKGFGTAAVADERADRLLAVLISYDLPSGCRGNHSSS